MLSVKCKDKAEKYLTVYQTMCELSLNRWCQYSVVVGSTENVSLVVVIFCTALPSLHGVRNGTH